MDAFLRNAEQILETALEAKECGTPEYLISISPMGTIQMLSETAGWTLPALAAENGAQAVYRVRRHGGTVRVEGWSLGRKCLVSRELPGRSWPRSAGYYATLQPVELGGASPNDLSPQV